MTLELATVEPDPAPPGIVSAHDATSSFDCKVGGCPRPSYLNRGMYAYLCDHHRAEKVEADREERALAAPAAPRAAQADRGDSPPAAGLVEAVEALKQPAERLERALDRRKDARAEATAAVAEFNTALRTLRELAEKLLA